MNKLRLCYAVLVLTLSLSAASREIYNSPAVAVTPGVIAADTLPSSFNALDYHLRIEIPRNISDASWRVNLVYSDSTSTVIDARREGSAHDDSFYGAPISVSVNNYAADGTFNGGSDYEIIKDIDPVIDGWSLLLTLNPDDTDLTCSLGQRSPLLTFPVAADNLRYITASTAGKLKLARLSVFCDETDSLRSSVVNNLGQLETILASSENPAEGLWRYLDRDTDLRRINLGADYMLATVCAPDGTIEILYLGHGGRMSADLNRWQPLMLKGRLKPTVFINHYDLIWYDAFGSKIVNETSADITDGAILKINFPLHGGSVRFQKFPMTSGALSR
ncbi:MAG: hypothetical protein K2M77_08170 [Muribaculaceae bacterium]|nr:hypothetical protein [Muribaculaceae bacterium]